MVVAAAGLVVACGWVSGHEGLTRWLTHGSDVVMNAAICLVLGGLGFLALASGWRVVAAVCGGALVALGSTVLLARWIEAFPRIDSLFWTAQWGTPGLPPGQMAPDAAVAFLFVGAALAILALRWRVRWLVPLLSGVIFAIALLPLLSFAVQWMLSRGLVAYRGMALPTALCLVVLAGAILRARRSEGGDDSLAASLLAAGLGMLASIGVVTLNANVEVVAANRWVAHSYKVRGYLDRFVAEVARMESTVRAYALTGDRSFRDRFAVHRDALLAHLATVRQLVTDNPVQSARAERLQILAGRKIAQGAALIGAADTGGTEGGARYLRSLDKADTSALVVLADEVRGEEDRLLVARTAVQQLAERDTRLVQSLGGLIALGLLVSALTIARRAAVARRAAEASLRASEVRFRHAFEDAGIGMALVGLDGRWLRVNRAVCDIVGYTAEELRQKTFQDITHPDDLAIDLERVRDLLEGRSQTYRLEKRYLHRDGHAVWINLTVSLVRDAANAPAHFISQIEDITWRKEFEAELRRARDRALAAQADLAAADRLHRAVLDGNEFSIIATRPDGVIKVFSGGAEKMLGYSAAEMVDRTTPAILHVAEEVRARAAELTAQLGVTVEPGFEAFVALTRSGAVDNREWTYVRKDGSRLPVRLSVTALRDEAGAITGFLGIAQDLTQRKKAEFALQASEERLQRVLARADCLVWEAQVRLAGDDWDWQFVIQPSGMYRRLFGEETPGEHAGLWYRFEVPEQTEMNRRCREAIVGRLPGYEQEFRLVRGGKVTWVHESVSILQSEPGYASLVGVAVDITERKRLEENLGRARDEALDASRLKSEFLATMSHEFRTPMNGVLGMVALLEETNLDAEQREMLRVARASTESLLVLIEDILDFSKLEAAKLRIQPADFDLVAVLEETVALLGPRAGEKRIELVGDFVRELGGTFHGDAARIRQVTTNLVGNAVKFTDRGEVVVRATVEREDEGAATVRLVVCDTGIGIAPEAHARLFRAFTQVDGTSTRRFGGTGLGLAISRQLVALMGGEIGFSSEPGRGSEFWFTLPLRRVAPPAPVASPLAGLRVLVVEENATARRVLADQLQRAGVVAAEAADEPAALARLAEIAAAGHRCDAILVDAHLSGPDGRTLVPAIRAVPAGAGVPLVLLSPPGALSDPAGPWVAAMSKPITSAKLLGSLTQVLAPPAAGAAKGAPQRPLPPRSGRGKRILVVEDNPANQIVIRMLLERLGLTVEAVASGTAALERLGAAPVVDLVFMDCQLPGLDGYETCRWIRTGTVPGADPRVPIVALTAYAMPEDRAKCVAAGMDDYLSKPIDPEQLSAVLDRCLQPAPASAQPKADPIDLKVVATLRELPGRKGPSLWPEMVELFAQQESGWLTELTQLAEAHAEREIARVAHGLAGSCASLGAPEMREIALAVERAALGVDWPAIVQGLTDLRAASERLHRALDAAT